MLILSILDSQVLIKFILVAGYCKGALKRHLTAGCMTMLKDTVRPKAAISTLWEFA